MKRIHYAWAICLACLWMYLCNIGLCSNILTVYLPFIEDGGISDSMGSAILSVRCLFSFVSTFFVGAFYKRFSLRTGILLASLVGAAAPLVFCFGGAFAYYFGAALLGIAYGMGCIYPVSLLLNNWFCERKGLAVGISSAGSGVATMLFSPLLSSVVLKYSLRAAFLAQSAFMALSAAAVFILVRDRPRDKGMEPYGVAASEKQESKSKLTAPLTRFALWMLALMMLLNGGAGLAFSGHLSVLTRNCGYSPELAANVVSVFGLTLVFSKLAAGVIADRMGTIKCSTLLISVFIFGCFLVIGMNGRDAFWCYAMVLVLGVGASVFNLGPPLWAGDLSSGERYASTLKWMQIFYNLGGIIFTAVPGVIAGYSGEYKSSYYMFAFMMFVSLNILLWAYRRNSAERAAAHILSRG